MNIRAALLLVLCFAAAAPVRAAVHIWTGAVSDRMSDAANWRGGSPAGDSDAELSFPAGLPRVILTNDIAGLTVRSIAISGSGYVIGGLPITLPPDAHVTTSSGENEIACDLVLSRGATLMGAGGLILSGQITGEGPVAIVGGGVTLAGSRPNIYSGVTRVAGGALRLSKADHVIAVPGDLVTMRTGFGDRHVTVLVDAHEQIADSATIRLGAYSALTVRFTETVGPMELAAGVRVEALDRTGTVILSRDVTLVAASLPGDVSFWGDTALSGMRTLTTLPGGPTISFLKLREHTPGAGLTVRGDATRLVVSGTYHGPTVIEAGVVSITNSNTTVRNRGGSFAGSVASLISEGGTVLSAVTTGDLRLTPATTAVAHAGVPQAILTAGGTLDVGGAKLEIRTSPNYPAVFGKESIFALNKGREPVRGTFSGAPDGSLVRGQFRIFYGRGDGNDITLTDLRRYWTATTLKADPAVGKHGQTVTFTAEVRRNGAAVTTGTVSFREGQTVVATVPLSASGAASLAVEKPFGIYPYTAEYSGSEELAPSRSATWSLRVVPPTPAIASVDPSAVQSRTTATLTIRGSGFEPGGTIRLRSHESSYVEAAPSFVSPNEIRFTWDVPGFIFGGSVDVSYQQPPPGEVRSNAVPLLVRDTPVPETPLIFEPKAVVGPVVPGGGAAWLAIASAPRRPTQRLSAVTPDPDRDGLVRWEQSNDIPLTSLWVMADMTDARVVSGQPDGKAPFAEPFPKAMFLRDPDGHYAHLILSRESHAHDLLWIRPGVGAWSLAAIHAADLDRETNDHRVLNVSQMRPVAGSEAPTPRGVEAGDGFIGLAETWHWAGAWEIAKWFGGRVDEQLRESDGAGTVSLTAQRGVHASEASGRARVGVLRFGGTDGEISVRYATADETAKAGVHYVAQAGTLTFGPGEILQTIEVPVINDSVHSGTTRFAIALSDPAGTTIDGVSSTIVTITDDEPLPLLTASDDLTVNEGDEGEREVRFVVRLNGETRLPVEASWIVKLGEYGTGQSGKLIFTPGGPSSQEIAVRYDANQVPESDRFFKIEIYDITNATPASLVRRLNVVDDDEVEIAILDASVTETSKDVSVRLAMTEFTERPVTVTYATSDGSATAGADFESTSGTVTFSGRSSQASIRIPIIDDAEREGEESFTLVFSDAAGATLHRQTATITIIDDESAVLPILSATSGFDSEYREQTYAWFFFRLSFPVAHEVRFRVVTLDGTATAADDFHPVEETIVIPPGSTSASLRVMLRNDSRVEPMEMFFLEMSEAVGATIIAPRVAATILDDDSSSPSGNSPTVKMSDVEVVEGDAGQTSARFTIALTRAATSPITVRYSTADGSAVSPDDYTAALGTLTFAPGETSKTIDVAVTGDLQFENDETFKLVLGRDTNVRIDPETVVCRIINDDPQPVRRRSARH